MMNGWCNRGCASQRSPTSFTHELAFSSFLHHQTPCCSPTSGLETPRSGGVSESRNGNSDSLRKSESLLVSPSKFCPFPLIFSHKSKYYSNSASQLLCIQHRTTTVMFVHHLHEVILSSSFGLAGFWGLHAFPQWR